MTFVQQSLPFLSPHKGLRAENKVIEAGAGTGKTTRIVKEVVTRLLEDPSLRPERIVLVTFTEKAAAEIADRVRFALTDLHLSFDKPRVGWPSDSDRPIIEIPEERRAEMRTNCALQLDRIDRLRSQTIHSFCQTILKAHALDAAIDPRFSIVSGFEQSRLMQEVFSRWLERETSGENVDHIVQWEEVLDRLGWIDNVRNAIFALVQKRELVEDDRLSLGDISEVEAAARAAIAAVRGTREGSSAEAFAVSDYFRENPLREEMSLDDWIDYLEPVNDALRACDLRQFKGVDTASVKFVRGEDKKRTLYDQLKNHRSAVSLRALGRRYIAALDEEKARRGVLDFDDLLLRTDALLEIPDVLEAVRRRYDCLFVDEFQDTDRIQARIIDRLARDASGELVPGRTVLVGDPKQSIYAFRRADPEMFAETISRFIVEGADREYLEQQYRSDKPLVEALNGMFAALFPQDAGSPLVARPAYKPVTAAKKSLLLPSEERIRFAAAEVPDGEQKEWVEAEVVADVIQQMSDGNDYRRFAVLVRKMANASLYADVFDRRGIPLALPPGRALLEQRAAVDLAAVLRAIAFPFDRGALIAAARTPYFGLNDGEIALHYLVPAGKPDGATGSLREDVNGSGERTLLAPFDGFVAAINRYASFARRLPVDQLVTLLVEEREIFTFYGLLKGGERHLSVLQRVREIATDYALNIGGSLREFVDELTRRRTESDDAEPTWANDNMNAVRLMTVHASKGLEFDVVIMPELSSQMGSDDVEVYAIDEPPSLVFASNVASLSGDYRSAAGRPLKQIQKERDQAELDRLFYVAVTRARAEVVFVTALGEKRNQSFWKPLTSIFALDLKTIDEHFPAAGERKVEYLTAAGTRVAAAFERFATPQRTTSGVERFVGDVSLLSGGGEENALPPFERLDRATVARRIASARRREAGIAMHRVLELWDREAGSVGSTLERVEKEMALGSDLARDLQRRLQSLTSAPTLQRLRSAEEVGREMPIIYRDAEGNSRQGRIDLLLRERGALLVVDYKRGEPDDDRLLKDREQVEQYCSAMSGMTSEPCRGLLWYIDVDTNVSIEV